MSRKEREKVVTLTPSRLVNNSSNDSVQQLQEGNWIYSADKDEELTTGGRLSQFHRDLIRDGLTIYHSPESFVECQYLVVDSVAYDISRFREKLKSMGFTDNDIVQLDKGYRPLKSEDKDNTSYYEIPPIGWELLGEEKPGQLENFLVELLANGLTLFYSPGLFKPYEGKIEALKIRLKDIGFTDDEIDRLDKGYSQLVYTNPMHLMWGAYNDDSEKQRMLVKDGWVAKYFRNADGFLTVETTFRFKELSARDESVVASLPTIVSTCVFSDRAKAAYGCEFVKAEVPFDYAPLLMGSDIKAVSFSADGLSVDTPLDPIAIANLYHAVRMGKFRFLGMEETRTPSLPNYASTEEQQQALNHYVQVFLKTLPEKTKKTLESGFNFYDEKGNLHNEEAERFFRIFMHQWPTVCNLNINSALGFDPVTGQFYFYTAAQTPVIESRTQCTFDQQAELRLKWRPREDEFQPEDKSLIREIVKVQVALVPPKKTEPNKVYAYPNGNVYHAFYVDPTGYRHGVVTIPGDDDELMFPSTDAGRNKVAEVKLVEKATYAYRMQAWRDMYIHHVDQMDRHSSVKRLAKPLFTALGRGRLGASTFDFGLYDVEELSFSHDAVEGELSLALAYFQVTQVRNRLANISNRKDNEDITDEEWKQLLIDLSTLKAVSNGLKEGQDALSVLETKLPDPTVKKEGDPRALVKEFHQKIDEFLDFSAEYNPLISANERALRGAWYPDLTEEDEVAVLNAAADESLDFESTDEQAEEKVLQARNRISDAVDQNPRLILLFAKHMDVTDVVVQQWDDTYSVLATAGYEGLDDIHHGLVDYAENALCCNNTDRQQAVSNLLAGTRQAIADIRTPHLMREPLKRVEATLAKEYNYLCEVKQLREEAPIPIPELLNQNNKPVPLLRDQNIEIQQAIYNGFKAANRTLPSRQQLRQYAQLVDDTEKKLKRAEESVTTYLAKVHGIPVSELKNRNGEIDLGAARQYAEKKSHPELIAKLKDPKIYSAVLALGIIERFKERHGLGQDRTNLHCIEDYEAVITALHGVLERNNKNRRPFQGNRFAKGFIYRDKEGWATGTTVRAFKANVPEGFEVNDGLEVILGPKPNTLFPNQQSFFSADLALELSEFEEDQFTQHQQGRIWSRRFSASKDSVLASTASSSAVVHSHHWVGSVQAALTASQTLEDLEAIEAYTMQVLKSDLTPEEIQALNPEIRRVRAAYAAYPTRREVIRDFLTFTIETQKLFIISCDACQDALNREVLKDAEISFGQGLDGIFARYQKEKPYIFDDENIKKSYQNRVKSLQVEFNVANQAAAQAYRLAHESYWHDIMQHVINPAVIEMDGKATAAEVIKVHTTQEAKVRIVPSREELAEVDKQSAWERAESVLEEAKNDRLQVLLEQRVKKEIENAVSAIEVELSVDAINEIEREALGNIEQMFDKSGLAPKEARNFVLNYLLTLKAVVEDQSQFAKSNAQFLAVGKQYERELQAAKDLADLSKTLKRACEAVAKVKPAKGHKANEFTTVKEKMLLDFVGMVRKHVKQPNDAGNFSDWSQLLKQVYEAISNIDPAHHPEAKATILELVDIVIKRFLEDKGPEIGNALEDLKKARIDDPSAVRSAEENLLAVVTEATKALNEAIPPALRESKEVSALLESDGTTSEKGILVRIGEAIIESMAPTWGASIVKDAPLWVSGVQFRGFLAESIGMKRTVITQQLTSCLSYAASRVLNQQALKAAFEEANTQFVDSTWYEALYDSLEAYDHADQRLALSPSEFMEQGWNQLPEGIVPAAKVIFETRYRAFLDVFSQSNPFLPEKEWEGWQERYLQAGVDAVSFGFTRAAIDADEGLDILKTMKNVLTNTNIELDLCTMMAKNLVGQWAQRLDAATRFAIRNISSARQERLELITEMRQVLIGYHNESEALVDEIVNGLTGRSINALCDVQVENWAKERVFDRRTDEAIKSEIAAFWDAFTEIPEEDRKKQIQSTGERVVKKVVEYREIAKEYKDPDYYSFTSARAEQSNRFLKAVEKGPIKAWARALNEKEKSAKEVEKEIHECSKRFYSKDSMDSTEAKQDRTRVLERVFKMAYSLKVSESQLDEWIDARRTGAKNFATIRDEVYTYFTHNDFSLMSFEQKNELVAWTMQEIDETLFMEFVGNVYRASSPETEEKLVAASKGAVTDFLLTFLSENERAGWGNLPSHKDRLSLVISKLEGIPNRKEKLEATTSDKSSRIVLSVSRQDVLVEEMARVLSIKVEKGVFTVNIHDLENNAVASTYTFEGTVVNGGAQSKEHVKIKQEDSSGKEKDIVSNHSLRSSGSLRGSDTEEESMPPRIPQATPVKTEEKKEIKVENGVVLVRGGLFGWGRRKEKEVVEKRTKPKKTVTFVGPAGKA